MFGTSYKHSHNFSNHLFEPMALEAKYREP